MTNARQTIISMVLGLAVAFIWSGMPARVQASGTTPAIPPCATKVASNLLGTNGPSPSDPFPPALTVNQLAQRVYDTAVSTQNFHAFGHRSIDPTTGDFQDASGRDTGVNATSPPGTGSTGGAASPDSCNGVNDPNATCHAYGGTANSVIINGNTCYTNPTGYDGCMGETNEAPQFTYYCGPGASRVMASNWYGPPMYNLGDSPPNSTSKGYAYYENTDVYSGTATSNMPGPINNDIVNHGGPNLNLTYGASGSQNAFQYRVGYDIYGYGDALITSLWTDEYGNPLPEWANSPKNVTHFVTIYGYDFTNYNGSIDYFDSSGPASGPPAPTRASQYVYRFWGNVSQNDSQVYVP